MIKIRILKSLRNDIYKVFKKDSFKVFKQIQSLEKNPNKGKILGNVGSMSIRELKFTTYRFYFIVDGGELNLFTQNKLTDLLIKFVEMSKKNNQEKTIKHIREILRRIGYK